jgi:asparagine synthase (glutamine-hydrolysing)
MSGQAGCFYFDRRQIDPDLIEILGQDLLQYGPDRRSHYAAPGLLMVHRACHFDSLSETETQPYVSDSGLVVTFDGRLDNRGDLLIWLRNELRGDVTDVAIAAAAYARWREEGLARLIGDWSLVVWNPESEAIVLASDYSGVLPHYYSFEPGGGIRWSSSLKSLINWTGSGEDLDESWIAAYLTLRPRFDRTVYRRIRSVPPAHAITASQGKIITSRFWRPSLRDEIRYRDERRYEEELLHHFREAVAVRLRSNRPVACDLSGGLDSSSITCMAQQLVKSGEVETKRLVALTEVDDSADDAQYATIVHESLGIDRICCNMEPSWSLDTDDAEPAMGTLRLKARSRLLLQEGVLRNLTGRVGDLVMGNEVDDCAQVADSLCNGNLPEFLRGAYHWSRALRIPIYHVLIRGIVPVFSSNGQETGWKHQRLREGNLYQHLERHCSCLTEQLQSRQSEDLSENVELLDWFKASPSARKYFATTEFRNLARSLQTQTALQPIHNSHPYTHRPLAQFLSAVPRRQLCAPGERRSLMRRAFERLVPVQVLKRQTKSLMGYRDCVDAQHLVQYLPRDATAWEVVKRGWVKPKALTETVDRIAMSTLHDWSEIVNILALESWLRAHNVELATASLTRGWIASNERR